MTDRASSGRRTAVFRWWRWVGCAACWGVLAAGCATASAGAQSGASYDDETFANRPTLKMKWRRALNPPEYWQYEPREYATPLLRQETGELYVGVADGTVFKLRSSNGQVQWRMAVDGPVHAQPIYGDGRIYVGTLDGTFYGLDAATGEPIWTAKTDGSVESKAAFGSGRVFYTTTNNRLIAADAATGKRLWSFERSAPEYFTLKESAEPVVGDDAVYCGFADGALVALQIDTGQALWKSDLGGGHTEFIDVDQAAVTAGSRIFGASYDGGLYAIDKSSGEHIWRQPLNGITDFVYGIDNLYVATAAGRIVAVRAKDGQPQWGFHFQDYSPVELTATQLYLFVATASGPMYVIDRRTGHSLMSWDPSSGFNTRVVFGQTTGFALSNRGYLYGFDVAF